MATAVILLGWDRPVPGRERQAGALFQEALGYYARLQGEGAIESFEAVLLSPHGGDMNGFMLIRGEPGKLAALEATEQWHLLVTRAGLLLDGLGVVTGVTGEGVAQWMASWVQNIPA